VDDLKDALEKIFRHFTTSFFDDFFITVVIFYEPRRECFVFADSENIFLSQGKLKIK
jgi:hypothetical protein